MGLLFFGWLLFFLLPDLKFCYFWAQKMNPLHQIENQALNLDDQNYLQDDPDYGIAYGIMSRYTPLSGTGQVGKIGLLDSDCFHLHSVIGKISKNINFVYYVCFTETEITKYVRFKDDTVQENFIPIKIDNNQFENVWFYLQINLWPNRGEVQIFLIQYPDVVFQTKLQIKYPFSEKQLKVVFGGGLDGYYDNELLQYSYFPGEILYYGIDFDIIPQDSEFIVPPLQYIYYVGLSCYQNYFSDVVKDQTLLGQDKYTYTSSNPYTTIFTLAGWIRITEIFSNDENFIYQALKITSNLRKEELTNDNLSPFCLFYYISKNGNKLVITTYSYTFPSVRRDFSDNPFLITKDVDFLQSIYSWIYLSISLRGSELQVSIDFSDKTNQILVTSVNHFHQVTFQIQFGNIRSDMKNHLNLQVNSFQFLNCDYSYPFQKSCHFSCQTCDGPTSTDCLTCQEYQDYIYIPSLKQCVCPYNQVLKSECKTTEKSNFQIIQSINQQFQCQFGYFQVEQECFQCPYIINERQIYCLECIFNPKTWINMMYCANELIARNGRTYSATINPPWFYYIFDGESVSFCLLCDLPCLDQQCLYADYLLATVPQVSFQTKIPKRLCQVSYCRRCNLSDGRKSMICVQCDYYHILINGVCVYMFDYAYQGQCFDNCAYCEPYQVQCFYCFKPYYLTHDRNQCKLCRIKNCKLCFEYDSNDISQNTLLKDFYKFDAFESLKVGCSLCEDGYIFDFTLSKCIYGNPLIINCSKSFINQKGEEVCILSTDNFLTAPQTTNCQKYIQNCQQCILIANQLIQCMICNDGYATSSATGECEQCKQEFAVNCVNGDFRYIDQWTPLIQSFLMQFLQDSYVYSISQSSFQYLQTQALECVEGYRVNKKGICKKYCTSDCLECQELFLEFVCVKCPVNYYGDPNFSTDKGSCLVCPKLCKLCFSRNSDEIKVILQHNQKINSLFVSNNYNIMYTHKCFQTQPDQNIQIDQELQIAKYCFNNDCKNTFKFAFGIWQGFSFYFFSEDDNNYYENWIDTEMCNQMGISEFYLSMSCQTYELFTSFAGPIQTSLKKKIFSLQFIEIELLNMPLELGLQLNNFDSVRLQQGCYAPEIQYFALFTNCNLYLYNYNLPVDLTLFDSVIQAKTYYITQVRIVLSINRNFKLNNFQLLHLYLSNNIWLHYKSNLDEKFIEIENLYIEDCIFDSVTLFSFHQYKVKIKIFNLTFYNVNMINSILINFPQSTLSEQIVIETMILDHCRMNRSTIILNLKSTLISISDLVIVDSNITDSTLFLTEFSFKISNFRIENNQFNSSILLGSTTQTNQLSEINFYFSNSLIINNEFLNSSLFTIHQNNQQQTSIYIEIFNFTHDSLLGIDDINSQVYLYDIQCKELKIQDLIIKDSKKLFYFKIQYSEIIQIMSVTYNNSLQNYQIHSSLDCVKNQDNFGILLHIQGFSVIDFHSFAISNIYSSDQPLVLINSDVLYKSQDKEIIKLQNLTFKGNILLKTKLGNILSLLAIFSELSQLIEISVLNFEENFFHQYVDDPSQTAAGLLFISSLQSFVNMDQLTCNSNGLTNSSYSFITINALNQRIGNMQIFNANILNKNKWLKYYNIEYEGQSDLTMNLIIQNIFKISNKGGACKIQSSEIQIIDAQFINLLSSSSSVFEITTLGSGKITLANIRIVNASVLLTDNVQALGSITIHAVNSLLHAVFTNLSFENVNNRLSSAIFSITPSLKSNYINIQNLSVIDCFTFMNQLINVQFTQQSLNSNQLIIEGLIVAFSQTGWIQYLSQIIQPTQNEIVYFKQGNNALILIQGCSIKLINVKLSGMIVSPILKVTDFSELLMVNLIIQNIQVIYPLRLIQIQQTIEIQHNLIIQQFQVVNVTQLEFNYSSFKQSLLQQLVTDQRNCQIVLVDENYINTNASLFTLSKAFNQEIETKGCFMFVQGLSQFSKVKIKSVSIQNNICNFCYDGIFNVQQKSIEQLIIEDFSCVSNVIRQFGCLFFSSEQNIETNASKARIRISNFVANNGTQGVGLYFKNMLFIVENSRLIQNVGSYVGGALFGDIITNEFMIYQTIITKNSANIGGGIYMNGNSHLTGFNFIKSLLAFNTAKQLSNNLVEAPDHLMLVINDKEMKFKITENSKDFIQVLQLKPYIILMQGKYMETNILHLSSGTEISNYQYYDPKLEKFLNYITQFQVVFKNSLDEKIEGNINDVCSLGQRIQISGPKLNSDFSFIRYLEYDSQQVSYQLGNVELEFDPYLQDTQLLQLQIECQSQYKKSLLLYQLDAKTFLCQLGEFTSNGKCETCLPSQGFYSVTYNTTQCSIFDETRLKNITSNRIQLKSGYWRPNKFSNNVDLCYKNQQYCVGGWGVNDALCLSGHVGGLCEECDTYNVRGDGYFVKLSNSKCGLCQTTFYAILPFLLVSLWSFITIFLTLKSNQSTKQTFARLKATTKLYQIIFKLNQGNYIYILDFESIFLKMFLNNLWIFSIIFTFNINFDFQFSGVSQVSNPNSSMALNLDCFLYFSANFELAYVRIIAMITLIMAQFLLVFLGQLAYVKFKQISFDISVLINTAVYLYVSNQAELIKHLGSLVAIRTISEIDYVQGDVKLLYYQTNHLSWMFFLIIPCLGIIGICIPLGLFVILVRNRDQFNEINFRKHLGYLFNEYTNRNQFWEQIKIWERFIIIIIVTSFETNIYYKVSLLSLTILLYLELMAFRKPYIINSLQQMEQESSFLILVAMFLAQVKYICEQDENQMASQLLQVIILTLCVRLCYCFLFRILQLYIKKYKQKVLFLFMRLFYQFGESSPLTHYLQRIYQDNNRKSKQLTNNLEILRRWRKNVQYDLMKEKLRGNYSMRRLIRSDNLLSIATQRINSIS